MLTNGVHYDELRFLFEIMIEALEQIFVDSVLQWMDLC